MNISSRTYLGELLDKITSVRILLMHRAVWSLFPEHFQLSVTRYIYFKLLPLLWPLGAVQCPGMKRE
jgi:hypothetical protein